MLSHCPGEGGRVQTLRAFGQSLLTGQGAQTAEEERVTDTPGCRCRSLPIPGLSFPICMANGWRGNKEASGALGREAAARVSSQSCKAGLRLPPGTTWPNTCPGAVGLLAAKSYRVSPCSLLRDSCKLCSLPSWGLGALLVGVYSFIHSFILSFIHSFIQTY